MATISSLWPFSSCFPASGANKSLTPLASIDSKVSKEGQQALASQNEVKTEALTPHSSSVSWLQVTSAIGSLTGIITVISGLALNMMGITIIGAIYTLSALTGFYYSYSLSNLKEIDEYTTQLETLTTNLETKDQEIRQLSTRLEKSVAQFSTLETEYRDFITHDKASQKTLQTEMETTRKKIKHATEAFNHAQLSADQGLDKQMGVFQKEEAHFEAKIHAYEAQVSELNTIIEKTRREIDSLQQQISSLEKANANYVIQNTQYSLQNQRLEEQLKLLTTNKSSDEKVLQQVVLESKKLQKLVQSNTSQASKISATTAHLSDLLSQAEQP